MRPKRAAHFTTLTNMLENVLKLLIVACHVYLAESFINFEKPMVMMIAKNKLFTKLVILLGGILCVAQIGAETLLHVLEKMATRICEQGRRE